MKYILASGKKVMLDDDIYEWASGVNWCLTAGYPSRRVKGKIIYLHRLIMNPGDGLVVDHISGNKLDNTRSNLRIVTHRDNISNRPFLNKNNTSGHRGVNWSKSMAKWEARVKVNYKYIRLGYFDKVEDAAKVVEKARKDLYVRTSY